MYLVMYFIYFTYLFFSGNYFSSHFIMGGERFDTAQPEMYLFGENMDVNFLGSRPAPVSWWGVTKALLYTPIWRNPYHEVWLLERKWGGKIKRCEGKIKRCGGEINCQGERKWSWNLEFERKSVGKIFCGFFNNNNAVLKITPKMS